MVTLLPLIDCIRKIKPKRRAVKFLQRSIRKRMSAVWDEAEKRLHAPRALLVLVS